MASRSHPNIFLPKATMQESTLLKQMKTCKRLQLYDVLTQYAPELNNSLEGIQLCFYGYRNLVLQEEIKLDKINKELNISHNSCLQTVRDHILISLHTQIAAALNTLSTLFEEDHDDNTCALLYRLKGDYLRYQHKYFSGNVSSVLRSYHNSYIMYQKQDELTVEHVILGINYCGFLIGLGKYDKSKEIIEDIIVRSLRGEKVPEDDVLELVSCLELLYEAEEPEM